MGSARRRATSVTVRIMRTKASAPMSDHLSATAHQKPISANVPVHFAGVQRRSQPDFGHDGPHAVDRDVGAGYAEQSATLVVDGLGYADQDFGAAGVQERLAEISLPGALGAAVPFVLGIVEVVADGGRMRIALPVDANQRVPLLPIPLFEGDVNTLRLFDGLLI